MYIRKQKNKLYFNDFVSVDFTSCKKKKKIYARDKSALADTQRLDIMWPAAIS